MNAAVAGVITAVVGEIAATVMEKIARGELSAEDLDWVKKFADSEFSRLIAGYLGGLGKELNGKDAKEIGKVIVRLFEGKRKG